jgi:hypothetical protein
MPRKPAVNKISEGRSPKPAANKIKSVSKSLQIGELRQMQDRLAAIRNKLPVGANANNAVASRGKMGGPVAGTLAAAATPAVRKLGTALGEKAGVALRPVGRAIDRLAGTKPKKKS